MDDKLKSAAYFNRHSSTLLNRNGYWNRDYRVTAGILAEKRARRLADIGCGNGAFLALFHRVAPQVQLSGLDLSREMVLRARQRLPEAGIFEGDAENMPFADGCFDAVSCHMSIHHHPHPDSSLREMRRILADGGTVLINELTGPKWLRRLMNWCFTWWNTGDHAVYSEDEMKQMLRTAGFANVESRRISPISYVCTGVKQAESERERV